MGRGILTKAEAAAAHAREVVRLRRELESQQAQSGENYKRARAAEDELDALREKIQEGGTGAALEELADHFETIVAVPDMTEAQFEAVRNARMLAGG